MKLDEKRQTAFLALFKLLSQIGRQAGLPYAKFQLTKAGRKRTIAEGHFYAPGHRKACEGNKWCVMFVIPNDGSNKAQVITKCEAITDHLASHDGSILKMLNRPILWGDAIRVLNRIICTYLIPIMQGRPAQKARDKIDALAGQFDSPD